MLLYRSPTVNRAVGGRLATRTSENAPSPTFGEFKAASRIARLVVSRWGLPPPTAPAQGSRLAAASCPGRPIRPNAPPPCHRRRERRAPPSPSPDCRSEGYRTIRPDG